MNRKEFHTKLLQDLEKMDLDERFLKGLSLLDGSIMYFRNIIKDKEFLSGLDLDVQQKGKELWESAVMGLVKNAIVISWLGRDIEEKE